MSYWRIGGVLGAFGVWDFATILRFGRLYDGFCVASKRRAGKTKARETKGIYPEMLDLCL